MRFVAAETGSIESISKKRQIERITAEKWGWKKCKENGEVAFTYEKTSKAPSFGLYSSASCIANAEIILANRDDLKKQRQLLSKKSQSVQELLQSHSVMSVSKKRVTSSQQLPAKKSKQGTSNSAPNSQPTCISSSSANSSVLAKERNPSQLGNARTQSVPSTLSTQISSLGNNQSLSTSDIQFLESVVPYNGKFLWSKSCTWGLIFFFFWLYFNSKFTFKKNNSSTPMQSLAIMK